MASEITMVKIRAKITIGDSFTVETPYILSFNVNKQRGQVSTFDASTKVLAGTPSLTGGQIIIEAGTDDNLNKIFSGIVKKATIKPCFDDPQYVIIDLAGADVLSLLAGKKFTRRCKASKTAWISIEGVGRKGLKSGKFKYKKEETMVLDDAELDETSVTKSMSSTNLGPWDSVKQASEDRSIPGVTMVVEHAS